MANVIKKRTLWNVGSASIGGAWNLDARRGLLRGVIYINKADYNSRKPLTITLVASDGSTKTFDSLVGATVRDVTLSEVSDYGNDLLSISVTSEASVLDGIGLYQVDAQFTVDDGQPTLDGYSKAEVDDKVSLLLPRENAAKVNKATATTSSTVSQLSSSADLATTISKVNEVISCLMAVRGTNSSVFSTLNSLVDSLTGGDVLKP